MFRNVMTTPFCMMINTLRTNNSQLIAQKVLLNLSVIQNIYTIEFTIRFPVKAVTCPLRDSETTKQSKTQPNKMRPQES